MNKKTLLKFIPLALLVSGNILISPKNAYSTPSFSNPTPEPFDSFSFSLSLSGNNLLISSPGDDTQTTNSGAAYLFDFTTGSLEQTFLNPTPNDNDRFGDAVAISGNNALIGVPADDSMGINSGAAYLFDANQGNLLEVFFNPSPTDNNERFGESVAISGNQVLVGTQNEAAYLFDATARTLVQTFLNPLPTSEGNFGFSVAVDNNQVLIGDPLGDPLGDNAGIAYLFDSSTGDLLQTFNNPTPENRDNFGFSLDISGNNVIIGAQGDDTGGINSGAAYVFDATTGDLIQTFLNPTPANFDSFGFSVGISGNNVVVGAFGDDTGAQNAGAAYAFNAITGELLQTYLNTSPEDGEQFGLSIAIDDNNVLIGTPGDNAGGFRSGGASQFQVTSVPEPSGVISLGLLGLATLSLKLHSRGKKSKI